jgi:glycosyltransferase involved in cell wall biosynthesis
VKLVFVTQVIDAEDAVLGFVPRWIQGLARHCERVRVVALEAGDVSTLPANADVRVLGRRGVLARWLRYRRFLAEAFDEGFDAVLAHMVPRYALAAAGPCRARGARLYLWYTHKGVDARLRRALPRVRKVFTASAESLRCEAPNKVVTGHGIDLAHFDPRSVRPAHPPRFLTVGRVTPAKDPLTIVAAVAILVARGHDVHLDVVGGELAAGDAAYARSLREAVELGGLASRVALHGAVPYRAIPALYARATALVSASLTGSVDKVVLEGMASRRPVVTCNESFAAILAPLGARAAALGFPPGDAGALAERLAALLALPVAERARLGDALAALVARDHEVEALMARLAREMAA